jgi:hypothetical protein
MKIAIHQPWYFPWIGFFDKLAKVDKFIFLDEVQLQDRSYMFRNRLITNSGDIKYLTISYIKRNYIKKKYKEIEINTQFDWQKKHSNFIKTNYKKTLFFDEVWDNIKDIFDSEYIYLNEVCIDCVTILGKMLDINTEITFQSNLDYDKNAKKSDLNLNICKILDATVYLSGQGGKNYMNIDSFAKENIQVVFQEFKHFSYPQINSVEFIPGISILDMFFNCGLERSREIFWNNINNSQTEK